jgi:hypothetical protein
MGLRFQKRIRLFKGLTLNLSKTGTSFSLGGRGARVNIRGDKVTGTVGIPGTGLSYRERLDKPTERPEVPTIEQEVAKPINGWKILAILLAAVLVIILLKWL